MFLAKLKKAIGICICFAAAGVMFAQSNSTVELDNDVYSFLVACENKAYCERLSNVKPYTKNYIVKLLNQVKEKLGDSNDAELEIVNYYLERFDNAEKGLDFSRLSYSIGDENSGLPITFIFNNYDEAFVSSGFYSDSSLNSTGIDIFHHFNFTGDLGKNVSYRASAFAGATKMNMKQVGNDYLIGYWWYEPDWREEKFENPRTINTYRNYNVLPYSYKKPWDGSTYPLKKLDHSGLEGWAFAPSLGFGVYGEIRTSLFDDMINIGAGRINHEWAAMDEGSSLVMNQSAAPFMGIDAKINLFKHVSLSTMTGAMEFPNAAYINENAWDWWDKYDYKTGTGNSSNYGFSPVDSYFFQNLFSMEMIDVDFEYLHLDFGSGVIWPKRFDLGYMFPLINKVVYQNSLGDYDNLSLFGDIKGYLPGIGSLWLSVYIDEIDALKTDLFEKSRCMFAYQAGTKVSLPWLPFTTVSLRYTKLEPYCYTHQAIRKQPWYDGYISESYTNNGRSLGYYLEPNSDELFVRAETQAVQGLKAGLQYQMIRHGADYGSGQVAGSSIWSEMSIPTYEHEIGARDSLKKYFLHDGVYEWSHIIALDASYTCTKLSVPFKLYATVGYVYDYFTQSEGGANKKTPYHRINTHEYPTTRGCVVSLGVKLFSFEQF